MGTLTDIGVLVDGELGTSAKQAFITEVLNTIKNGFVIGDLTLAGGQITLAEFESGDPDLVKSTYPAWYGVYIDSFLKSIAQFLDLIPDAAVLSPFIDPTKPILKIIVELKELFDEISLSLSIPLIDILLSKISIVIAKADDLLQKLTDAVNAVIDALDPTEYIEKFYEAIKSIISDVLAAAGEAVDTVLSKIEEAKDQIIEKLNEIIQKIVESLNISLPSFSLPSLNIDFIDINLTKPLFAVKETDGFDGIGTKFLKTMASFITIPAQIIDQITGAIAEIAAEIQEVKDAILSIFGDIVNAIQRIYEALLGFVWKIISAVFDILDVAFLEIASIITVVVFFVKYFIISLLGFLIGAGLISYSAAQQLGIL